MAIPDLRLMLRIMRDPETPAARRDAMAIAAAPYVHSKLAQADVTDQHNYNITGVRFWTEEEWLHRDAHQGNSRLMTSAMRLSSTNRKNTSRDCSASAEPEAESRDWPTLN